MTYIKQQLDCFGPHQLLLGRYQLLGSKERRTGGMLLHLLSSSTQYQLLWAEAALHGPVTASVTSVTQSKRLLHHA